MKTFVRIFVDLCIVILLVLFAFFLLYLHTGSWEMVPTEEDQGKALVVSAFGMIVTGVPCAVCIGLRATVLRKRRGKR